MTGWIDGFINGNIQGWMADGDTPVTVQVVFDGAQSFDVLANAPRPDVVTAGKSTHPDCGIVFPVPDVFKDGKPHTFKVTYKAGTYVLDNQPAAGTSFTVAVPAPPPTTETRSVKIDWTTQDQMRTDFANFGKFRLSVGSLTPIMITDLTLRTYTMADIPVGTYNVELALVSLDGATVAGTITGVLTVTSAITPPPPPPPEQGVPVPATLSFTLL